MMTMDAGKAKEAHAGIRRPLHTGGHVNGPVRTAIAACTVALSITVALPVAAVSLALWFYGAWPAGVELAVLAACALGVALTAVSARMWVHGEL